MTEGIEASASMKNSIVRLPSSALISLRTGFGKKPAAPAMLPRRKMSFTVFNNYLC